jgi:dsDNA-specific endonuclease/ATPase MutS2
MDTVSQSIPFTAWEQAVFVGLFIVLVVMLLGWFTKQSDKWQNFIAKLEEQWRVFNREQRQENNACIQGLVEVVQQLLLQVKEMRDENSEFYSDFHNHDQQAKEILGHIQNNSKTVAKPRSTKSTTSKE